MSFFDRLKTPSLFGLPVVVSEAATALPKLKAPITDDMRAMVDDLLVRCPPQREPAAFRMGGQMVVHPAVMDRLVRQMPTHQARRPWFTVTA